MSVVNQKVFSIQFHYLFIIEIYSSFTVTHKMSGFVTCYDVNTLVILSCLKVLKLHMLLRFNMSYSVRTVLKYFTRLYKTIMHYFSSRLFFAFFNSAELIKAEIYS